MNPFTQLLRFLRQSARLAPGFCLILALSAAGGTAAESPQTSVQTIKGTLVKFEMVRIPGGSFTPGGKDAGSTTAVKVAPFWIGKTEVRWDEYDIFALRLDLTDEQRADRRIARTRPSKPYGAPDYGFGHQGYPVLSVTYYAAEQYCRWLSSLTGRKYRLPTEIEWEYAARAGATAPLKPEELEKQAWHWENAEDKTHAVATKAPNAWGLHDMLGNAGEWATATDGQPVLCGGTYNDRAANVHYGARARQTPAWNVTDPQDPKSRWWLSDGPFVGFRVVREE
jgi:formylglycine-generating enzyme required for sulfatase activity